MQWDFWSLSPESLHQMTFLMSDRGTPRTLNRNPENFFAEVEQSAFEPANMVPGIGPSPGKMLQGRLFSYPDTHRHRIGVNYAQLADQPSARARQQLQQGRGHALPPRR